jgi:hypothetical protein
MLTRREDYHRVDIFYKGVFLVQIRTRQHLSDKDILELMSIDMDRWSKEHGFDGWDYNGFSRKMVD